MRMGSVRIHETHFTRGPANDWNYSDRISLLDARRRSRKIQLKLLDSRNERIERLRSAQ